MNCKSKSKINVIALIILLYLNILLIKKRIDASIILALCLTILKPFYY